MAAPVIPSVESLLTPAIDAIVAARPETLVPFNTGGRWTDLIAMWRAELLVALARLSDECRSSRLRTATGDALRSLCASEFQTTLAVDPQTAIGTAYVERSAGPLPGGVLAKKGDIWVKKANPNAIPVPIPAQTYEVTTTVYAPPGGGNLDPGLAVPLIATSPGVAANIPNFSPSYTTPQIQPSLPFFDSNFTVKSVDMAGGSSGLTDPVLVAAARAYAKGQFGPTDAALVASILRSQSARHYAVFEASDAVPYDQVYVADESWASSTKWTGQLWQSFSANFQGFGCRARFGQIQNEATGVNATIVLKNSDDLTFTDQIDANVEVAVQSFFDDRLDWYSWSRAALQAAITAADNRILQCISCDPVNLAGGNFIGDVPTSTFGSVWQDYIVHYYLIANNLNTTYLPPF